MQTITFTQLRTQPKKLKQAIDDGQTVDLIHRSQIVAEIRPKRIESKTFNVKRFSKIAEKLNLPHLAYAEREKRYREAIEKKHGKAIRGH